MISSNKTSVEYRLPVNFSRHVGCINLLFFICCFLTPGAGQSCLTGMTINHYAPPLHQIDVLLSGSDTYTSQVIRPQLHNAGPRSIITLSVVVHVVWREENENISVEQIRSQIEVLNEDFRKLNANFSLTPAPFKSLAADIEIEFCLATLDPGGFPTNGITRTQTHLDNIGLLGKPYITVTEALTPGIIKNILTSGFVISEKKGSGDMLLPRVPQIP